MNDHKPLVLLSHHFHQEDASAGQSQCDCACPENGFALSAPPVSRRAPLQHARLHMQPLPGDHTLMFNAQREGGVAVLNPPARQIWERFRAPRTLDAAGDSDARRAARAMAEAGLLEPPDATVQPRVRASQTLSVWLHVTNECNLRCSYCYINKTSARMSAATGRAAIDAIFRSARKGNMQRVRLKFAGGEPTLNLKLVLDLHEYARDRAAEAGIGLEAVILSNGVALGERSIRALKARGIQVMISLDGVGAMHDRQRPFANGTGSFAWVDRALDRLDRQGVRPFVSVTVSDRNIDGLPQVVSYLLDRDLPFNLNFFRDNDCATPFHGLRAEQARLIAALHETFDIIEARLPARSLLGSLIDRARLDQAHDKPCSVGDSYLVVTHTGHIAKCQMEVERPITDIAADDPLRLVQIDRTGVQNVSVDEKEGCRDCAWKYWCGGGCPVLTYRATGRYDVKSPYCNVYKALYPRALRLEGLRLLKLSGALQ